MQTKRKVGRPRKIVDNVEKALFKQALELDTLCFDRATPKPQSHTRERVDELEDTVYRMKLVLLSMSEAIEREDFDNLSKEVRRILNV